MRKFGYETMDAGRALKKFLMLFSLCCMMTADVSAAGRADASKCTFKVQKKGGNRQKVEGGYSTTLKISEVYEAEIRWRGEEAARFLVETVYMVSEDKRSFPHSSAVYSVTIEPNALTNIVLETPEFVRKDYAYGSGYGIKFEGIIARLKKDGQVLKTYTSKNDSNWKKLASEKTIKTKCVAGYYAGGTDSVQVRLLRVRAGETAPGGTPEKGMSPAEFVVNRPNKLVAFSAMASLSNDYYGEFYGLDKYYYCISLTLRKFGTPCMSSYGYDGSGGANRYVRAYVGRKTELGQKVMTILSDGKRHDVNVDLHFPPSLTDESSSGGYSSWCFIDQMETNVVWKTSENGASAGSAPVGQRGTRRAGADASSKPKNEGLAEDSAYEVGSFCGYKFGSDYRGSNQSNGYYSSSPDMVRVRLERPFRNFRFATLNHGKAGMQSVALYYYDETHAMKNEDLEAEVVAVKGVLEKKYGITFGGSTAQRGKMLFSVYRSGNGIRLEVTNRAVVRRGQNFGTDGGADVL